MKIILLFVLLFACNHQLNAQNSPLAVIPFELKSDSRIYIKCRINNSDTLTFLFDTGAGAMVINKDIIGKKLNLDFDSEVNNQGANGENKVKKSNVNMFSFGGIKLEKISFLAIPYGNAAFDGVFGFNLMMKYIIDINYRKKLMFFYDPKNYLYQTDSYDKFDLKFGLGVPTIKASLVMGPRKVTGEFELDSGGDSGLILARHFTNVNRIASQFKQVAQASIMGSDGVVTTTPIVVVPEILLKNKRFYRLPALLSASASGLLANSKLAGIFGNLYLKRFDMILDFGHQKIYLKSNDLLHMPYYDFLIK